MSFLGAVASSVRQVLARYTADVSLPCLIIGAGNFTVPSVLRSGGYTGSISACDVTLYTSALGAYLSGWSLDAREREDCPEHLRGLLRTGAAVELAASISLLLDLREVWQAKNPWQERQVEHSRAAWDALMERTIVKLEAYKGHIGEIDYQARDGFDLLAASDNAHTVFAFPPTYKAGYEKLEALLRAVVDWTPPPYKEMTDKSLELFESIARFDAYYVVLEKELPEVYAILGKPSAILPRGRGRTTTVIAKSASKVVVRCNAKTAPIAPIWPPDAPVTGTETPGFTPISRAQSLRLNELYLARRIDYYEGGVDACLAFTLNGKVVGKADIIRTSQGQWKLPPDNAAGDTPFYIMCDLAVASDVERRLAKLVLCLLGSIEVKSWLDAKLCARFGWALTTAFSAGPVSMKYRGVFDLYSRKQDKKTGQFALNYFCPLGTGTLAERFALWCKKFSNTLKK